MKEYFSIFKEFENEIVIQKSRFITTLLPIENYADAQEKLAKIAKKYFNATHNCYAFIANDIATEQKFSDDGEPQGTAGVPMLEVLKKRQVYMVLAVVTRYFGGIKLGVGGLVSAYSKSVAEALNKCELYRLEESNCFRAVIDYSSYARVSEQIKQLNGIISDVIYGDNVEVFYSENASRDLIQKELIELTCGKANIEYLSKQYVKSIFKNELT